MKSLLLPLMMLATPAMAGEFSVGVGAGVIKTDPLEVLGTTWTVVPRVGYMFNPTLGLEADLGFMSGKTRVGDEAYPYLGFTPRLHVVGRMWTTGKRSADGKNIKKAPPIQPVLAAGVGMFYKSVNDDTGETDGNGDPVYGLGKDFNRRDMDFALSAGPGVRIPLGKTPLHFRTDLRWIVSLGAENYQNRGDQFVNWEWTGGIGLHFGKNDADKDGIVDNEDRCKDEAEDMDGWEDEDGCPDTDNDGDGLKDSEDTQCPNEAEDKDGIADDDGCPEEDYDEDGVLDDVDACPLDAGSKDTAGCPDQDGDTVADVDDECVEEAGSVDAYGCFDEDGDGVPNYRDMCPEEPVDARADGKHSDGCPSRVIVANESIVIKEKVFFDTGKATIKEDSFELLADVAKTMRNYRDIKKVQIEGHTDVTGDHDANVQLSKDRAQSVMKHLIEQHDIEAGRLAFWGFGPDKPLAEGDTEEAYAKNRRVEFKITERDESSKPTFTRRTLDLTKKVEFKPELSEENKDKLVAKMAINPEDTGVKKASKCTAVVAINAKGTVDSVKVGGCTGLARSVTRRAMAAWVFEPIKVEDEAQPHQALFTWDFPGEGKQAVVTVDENSIQPIVEDEEEEE